MESEIEAKFLDTSHQEIRKKLISLGARQIQPRRQMTRVNLDFSDRRLDAINGWVRVRNEGDKITLAYKQLTDRSLEGTKEVQIVVSSFEATLNFLKAAGLQQENYQETWRESWELDNTQVELDEWPWVKPFIEVEAPNEETLRTVTASLGLDWEDAKHGSVEIVYTSEYDVSEQEVDDWPEIVFGEVPQWLEEKRKITT